MVAQSTGVVHELARAVDRCNSCGFCQAGCPVYKATGIEWTVARGRVALLKAALSGRLELGDDIREPMFNCLTCGGCTDHCPPGVETAEIVTRARAEMVEREGLPWVQRLLFGGVLPRQNLLSAAVRTVWLGQVTGAQAAAKASGLLNLLGVSQTAEILPKIPGGTGRGLAKAALRPVTQPKYRVAYFLGCGTNNVFPSAAAATVRVLQRQGVEVLLPDGVCCGKPPSAYGDSGSARELARRNLQAFAHLDVDAVVTDCATCGSFLREYGPLLEGDYRYAEQAAAFSMRVQDVLVFLAATGVDERMGEIREKVTYHDPCHLGRFQKASKQPRELLRKVPGLSLLEMAEANMCCGGAGSYSLTHFDISMKVLDRKMANAARTGATTVVTACPGCAMQLGTGARRQDAGMGVSQVVEILDRAYSAL